MAKPNNRVAPILLSLLLPLLGGIANAGDQTIRFGSVSMDTPATMHQRLSPLISYLSHALNRPITLVLSPNMSAAIDAFIDHKVDIAYLTPVAYLRTKQALETDILAKALTQQRGTFRLAIITRHDSTIKTPEDLKGSRFAFGDRAALLQRAALYQAGLSLDSLLEYGFLNHRDNVIRAVLHGRYDAGIVNETLALKWRERGIRIVYTSPELPSFNISASPNVDQSLRQALRHALLTLDMSNPGQRAVITALDPEYTGFAAANDSDYDTVRALIAPFLDGDQPPLSTPQER